MMPSCNMASGDCLQDDVPQAMAFTVTFDSAKTTNNKFIKRHIRNLSLPITKVYDSKPMLTSALNGKAGKRPGNHSEGYFSSDPDEEHSNSKSKSEIQKLHLKESPVVESSVSKCLSNDELEEDDIDHDNEGGSEVGSETGTYTIKKESAEVITARLSIDANFGVEQATSSHNPSRDWVDEWTSQVINKKSQNQHIAPETNINKATISRPQQVVTKIPSPLTTRARFGTKNMKGKEPLENKPKTPTLSHRSKASEDCSDSETERLLKTTEKVMSALAARLSMDSGGESEGETRRSDGRLEGIGRARETKTNTTTMTTTTTRYNRAFSLRRGRLDESGSVKNSGNSPPPSVGRGVSSGGSRSEPVKPPLFAHSKVKSNSQPAPNVLSRTDSGRFSMRVNKTPQSPSLSGASGGSSGKKTSTGGRSNSTLSSKEVEFQNWKRRKSYDPMKAAAEGRKKEAANKRPPTTTTNTPKSPVNSVWRSASFHGTRQLAGSQSSSDDEEEEEEENLSVEEEDDWPLPQGPKTSLQNSPRGSKGSLYSNSSNNSPLPRQTLEGVEILLVSALHRLAHKQKGTTSTILKKLRCLYVEESHKYKLITSALEQLEQSEPSGSPHMSPSRELASTLTISKKLNSTFKILNEVLFDEVDLE